MQYPLKKSARELRIGDVIRVCEDPFGFAVVVRIEPIGDTKNALVYLERPYAATEIRRHAPELYDSMVLALSVERFSVYHNSDRMYDCVRNVIMEVG